MCGMAIIAVVVAIIRRQAYPAMLQSAAQQAPDTFYFFQEHGVPAA